MTDDREESHASSPLLHVDGVQAVSIPLPGYSNLRTANIYIVGRGPVTLIDTGPKFPGAFEELKAGIERAGFGLEDIERILLSHGHLDHFGLVRSLREAAGRPIPCHIHAEDRWRVTAEVHHEEMWTDEADRFMAMVDMPAEEVERVRKRFELFGLLCDPVQDVLPMEDGDVFQGKDYRLQVVHTPGHSTGTCCFYEPDRRILFSGDHVIGHITPNPFVEISRSRLRDPQYRSLRAYLDSLERLTLLKVDLVLPGHGAPVTDLAALVAGYRAHHAQRKERVWEALKNDPRPIFHLIRDVFPEVPEDDIFLAVSEILVHLELLIDEGRAELSDPGPPAVFRAL